MTPISHGAPRESVKGVFVVVSRRFSPVAIVIGSALTFSRPEPDLPSLGCRGQLDEPVPAVVYRFGLAS